MTSIPSPSLCQHLYQSCCIFILLLLLSHHLRSHTESSLFVQSFSLNFDGWSNQQHHNRRLKCNRFVSSRHLYKQRQQQNSDHMESNLSDSLEQKIKQEQYHEHDQHQQQQLYKYKANNIDRQSFLKMLSFGATITTSSLIIPSKYAYAEDDTMMENIESSTNTKHVILQSDQIAISSALRNVKNSIKTLQSTEMELIITTNDYVAVKEKLRVIPLSEIRKSCSSLMKYSVSYNFIQKTLPSEFDEKILSTMTMEEKINRSKLGISYQTYKKSLERMDSLASLGMRGRDYKTSNNEIWINSYQETITSLQSFLSIAEQIFRT